MINPKNITISSCIGFFLSFFIGLFSDVRFSHVLIRAFIFALVFAALCVGITFVYQKFLSTDSSGFSVEPDSVAPRAAGSVVNIVVDDTALTDDGLTPKFTVSGNHAAKRDAPVSAPVNAPSEISSSDSAESSVPPVSAENSAPQTKTVSPAESIPAPAEEAHSFKPMNLNEVSAASLGGSEEHHHAENAPSAENAPVEQLDELPDIGGMEVESDSEDLGSDSGGGSEEIVSDTEFATGGAKLKEQPISGDTNVMAKAIQTLLAQDNN